MPHSQELLQSKLFPVKCIQLKVFGAFATFAWQKETANQRRHFISIFNVQNLPIEMMKLLCFIMFGNASQQLSKCSRKIYYSWWENWLKNSTIDVAKYDNWKSAKNILPKSIDCVHISSPDLFFVWSFSLSLIEIFLIIASRLFHTFSSQLIIQLPLYLPCGIHNSISSDYNIGSAMEKEKNHWL